MKRSACCVHQPVLSVCPRSLLCLLLRPLVSATMLHKRLVLSWPSLLLLLFLLLLLLLLLLLPVHLKVEQITTVFTAATRQKAWDHFSKAQRKNIDIWRKQCEVGIAFFYSILSSHPILLPSSLPSPLSLQEKADRQPCMICRIQWPCCCFVGCFSLTDRQTASSDLGLSFCLQPKCKRPAVSSKVWGAAMATVISRVKSLINYSSRVKSR